MKTGSERITFQIHRNLLADLSVSGQNQMFGIRGFLMKDELYKAFVQELYERLDKEQYPTTLETLSYVVDMAMMILLKSMAMYYQNPSEKASIQVLSVLENDGRRDFSRQEKSSNPSYHQPKDCSEAD